MAAANIAIGALGALAAMVSFLLIAGCGLLWCDQQGFVFTHALGAVIAMHVGGLSLAWVIGGVGLLKHWNWARMLVLVLSVVALVGLPIGTLVGIYTIWVLVQGDTEVLFGCCEG